MEYRQLGKTDLQVSSIGLGCVTFSREIDEVTSFEVMDRALERGITLFDTAEAYNAGGSETVVGKWMTDRKTRDQVVLATKVANNLTRERVISSTEDSLRRLQVDVIDLLQVHNWDGTVPLEETLDGLNTVVEQGKVRYIGCSNYDAWQLCKSLWKSDVNGWARMESIQPNYNLVTRDIEKETLPLCADQSLGVISYSPLGAGFLTGKYSQGGSIPDGTRFDVIPGHQDIYFHAEKWRVMEGLRAKAAEIGDTMIQLALAWAIGQPGITSVLIGARHTHHVDQAFQAEESGLSDELRDALNSL
ncbi:MAG: aldo/keto reductase [Chloroflexota bacterium]